MQRAGRPSHGDTAECPPHRRTGPVALAAAHAHAAGLARPGSPRTDRRARLDPPASPGIVPRPRHVSVATVPLRPSRAADPRRTLPGHARDQDRRRRHAHRGRHAAVRCVPGGDRGGAADVAGRRARGPGDRGPELRALDHRLGGPGGGAPGDADLRNLRLSGLRRDPDASAAGPAAMVRGGAGHRRAGAHVRRPARGHRVLLHLERTDVRERGRVRELAAPLPAPGGRARRRCVAARALARRAAVAGPRHGAAGGRILARRARRSGPRRSAGPA